VRVEDLRWTTALARALVAAPNDRSRTPTDPDADSSDQAVAGGPAASAASTLPVASAASAHARAPDGGRLDAEVRLQVDRLSSAAWPAAAALDLTARLTDGVLAVAPLAFGIGRGRASGRFDLDTNRMPAQAQLRVDVRDVKLEAMLANVPAEQRVSGALSGGVDLRAHGRTPDEWLASAAGTVSARLHGGSMSRRLDAELGLSGARLLRALFGSDDRVPIRCAAADVELRAGQARSRTLLLETERTHVSGVGTADLKAGAFDLLLTPSPERPGLLELRKSIRLRGQSGSKVTYELAAATPPPTWRSCLERSP
jgi:uncharacterized protein involved in outer membrane biogenesis